MQYIVETGRKENERLWGYMKIPVEWDYMDEDFQKLIQEGLGWVVMGHGPEVNMVAKHENYSKEVPLEPLEYYAKETAIWEVISERLALALRDAWVEAWGTENSDVQAFLKGVEKKWPTPPSRYERREMV